MRKSVLFSVVMGLALVGAGCSPVLWNVPEKTYLKGDLRWYATDADSLNRNIRGRLAITKLANQPVQTATSPEGVAQGYLGVVANLDRYYPVNILIEGPETKSYYLDPGKSEEDYLIPGTYVATAYRRGLVVGRRVFHSEPQEKRLNGRKVHWYLVYNSYNYW